jgi:hypothetical protein
MARRGVQEKERKRVCVFRRTEQEGDETNMYIRHGKG